MNNFTAKPELKDVRLKFGASQKRVAEMVGIISGRTYTRTYYSLVESGKKKASSSFALKIAQILNTPVDEIFIYNGKE